MTNHDAFERCAALAANRFGVLSADQMLELGLSDDARARRIHSGSLIPMYRGTYKVAGAPASWRGRLLAAQLSAGSRAIVSHRSAAALLRLDEAPEGPIELLVPAGTPRSGIVQHRLRVDDRPEVRYDGPFRLTSPERTLLDLAAVLPIRRAGRALDDALRKRLTNLDRLWAVLDREGGKGRNGTANFRKLLSTRDGRDMKLRSDFEKRMLRIAKRVDKNVSVDVKVLYGRATAYYLDLAWPKRRLGIECQSVDWHFGDDKVKRDSVRDRHLKFLGWTILYFYWDEVRFTPDLVERDIRRAFALTDPR